MKQKVSWENLKTEESFAVATDKGIVVNRQGHTCRKKCSKIDTHSMHVFSQNVTCTSSENISRITLEVEFIVIG